MAGGLTSLEDAQAAVLALTHRGDPIDLPLHLARGWLAAPLIARRTQPWADLSAMDGYALGPGTGPWGITHAIPAESRDPGSVGANEAARIFTGAPLPAGADRILIQENAFVVEDSLTATKLPTEGRYVRRKGSDFTADAPLIDAGAAITPGLIALAATADHATLPCHRTPDVTIIATGSELVAPGSGASGLPSSNNPMLAALLAPYASNITDTGPIPDTLDQIGSAIAHFEASNTHPALLILTGGASVGDHDLVRPALEAQGWTIALHKIAMKPGKPLIVAHKLDGTGGQHFALGLPGNPVSAFVTATLFALPLLRKMAGCSDPLPRHETAHLAAPLSAGSNRTEYLRGRRNADGSIEAFGGKSGGSQDSAALLTLACATILIRLDIDAPAQDIGSIARYITIG